MNRGGSPTHLGLAKWGVAAIVLCCTVALLLLSHDEGSAAQKTAVSSVPVSTGVDAPLVEKTNAARGAPTTAPAQKASPPSAPGAMPRMAKGRQIAASANSPVSLPVPSYREDELQVRPLWRVDRSRSIRPDFPREDLVDVAHLLDLDSVSLASLSVGDQTTLVIPELGEFDALVERMIMAANGDLTWMGHLMGVDGSHSVIFTRGKEMTFATIDTPGGTYLLEGRGEDTWIFRDDLDDLIDPTQTDELVPTVIP